MLRTVQMASVASGFVLLLTLATAVWDGPSALMRTAAQWVAGKSLPLSFADEATYPRIAPSVTCDDDAAFFATCEAPVAQPLQSAVPAILESPSVMPSAIFAENAIDTGLPSHRCLALIDADNNNDAENDLPPTVASCCAKVEYPVPGAGRVAPGASGCSCDPQECKCT